MAPAARAALAALAALLSPAAGLAAPSLTVPPNGITSCTAYAPASEGGVQTDPADVQVTPGPQGLDVVLGAAATDSMDFPGLYEGAFMSECTLLGAGTLGYGEASGSLTLDASSKPDFLEPTPVNQGNGPFYNSGYGRGEALLQLQFEDTGVVVSDVLPVDAPVQLELTFLLDSVGVATGAPLGPLLATSATYFVRAVDTAAPGAPVERILSGSELVTVPLDTAVGRTIDIRGQLQLSVLARAGREVPGALYYAELHASVDAAHTSRFSIEAPENVRFEAESGHDYRPAPAPSQGLLLATGALVLSLAGRKRRARR